jgi:phage terminase small subunit
MPLTPKQERFVEEYLIDLNATQAAIRAGYSEQSAEMQGSRLLSNDKVAALLVQKRAARSARTKITQDYVLESIFLAMEHCKQADSFNAQGVFKGAELLGKHLGMFQGESTNMTVNLPFAGWIIERVE